MYEYFVGTQIAPGDGSFATTLRQDMHLTIDDMIACVPYAMGDVNVCGQASSLPYDAAAALVIRHSIKVVTYCCYWDAEQMQTTQQILSRIDRAIGLQPVAACKDELAPLKAGMKMQPFAVLL
jgi:hypothetical protein